jgi:hypothetical protein
MELDDQFEFSHLLLNERKCRVCGQTKGLIDGFYRTHRDRGTVASSYSYECKECTIERIINNRQKRKKTQKEDLMWEYPDW